MPTLRCKSCHGEYDPISRDGVPYFHACPFVTTVRVERGGAPIDVPLTDVRDTDLLIVERAGARLKVLPAALDKDDRRLGDTQIPRANHRDENVQITGYDAHDNPITAIKSAGLGVETI